MVKYFGIIYSSIRVTADLCERCEVSKRRFSLPDTASTSTVSESSVMPASFFTGRPTLEFRRWLTVIGVEDKLKTETRRDEEEIVV